MKLRLLGFAAVLFLVAPGCDSSSSNVLGDVSSSDLNELGRIVGETFDCVAIVRPITGRATGRLAASDCLYTDDTYVDFYAFRVDETALIDIEFTSNDFEPYIFLKRANISAVDPLEDIESGGTDNGIDRARLSISLRPGLYIIYADAYDEDEVGDYTLTVSAPSGEGRPAVRARSASSTK